MVRDFEFEFKLLPLETELFGIELEQIVVALIVVGCAQRAHFACLCSF